MSNWKKIAIGAGVVAGGAGIYLATDYFLKMQRTSAELEVITSAKVHKAGFSGIIIKVNVQLKNPTKGSLKIKYPFVKMVYKGETIGTSQVINKDIELPSFGEARIQDIMIQVPITGLLSIGKDLLQAINDPSTGIKMQIKTITTIYLTTAKGKTIKSIPYEKLDEITLKK